MTNQKLLFCHVIVLAHCLKYILFEVNGCWCGLLRMALRRSHKLTLRKSRRNGSYQNVDVMFVFLWIWIWSASFCMRSLHKYREVPCLAWSNRIQRGQSLYLSRVLLSSTYIVCTNVILIHINVMQRACIYCYTHSARTHCSDQTVEKWSQPVCNFQQKYNSSAQRTMDQERIKEVREWQ